MPVRLYIGISGSGKSYEVVTNLIMPAIKEGRRVVTNIAGVDEYEIKQYLIANGSSENSLGHIVLVTEQDIKHPHFFRHENDTQNNIDTFVKGGDLVALDEVWRFWKPKGDIPERHLNFFRMHRHHLHPQTGKTIEVALISQLISDFNPNIKGNSENIYYMEKAKKVGMDNHYRVEVYGAGGKMTNKNFIVEYPLQKYNPDFFKFYKSNSQNNGSNVVDERAIDNRGSIFKGAFFKFMLPITFVFGCVSIYYVYQFFTNNELAKNAKNEQKTEIKPSNVANALPSQTNLQAVQPNQPIEKKNQLQEVNKWYVVGYIKIDKNIQFTLSDGVSYLYLMNPEHYFVGKNAVVHLPDGTLANSFNKPKNHEFKVI